MHHFAKSLMVFLLSGALTAVPSYDTTMLRLGQLGTLEMGGERWPVEQTSLRLQSSLACKRNRMFERKDRKIQGTL